MATTTVTLKANKPIRSGPPAALIVVPILGTIILMAGLTSAFLAILLYYLDRPLILQVLTWLGFNITPEEQVLEWKRLEQPISWELYGHTVVWLIALGIALGLALVYLVWMFVRERRAVDSPWAAFRAGLRCLSLFCVIVLGWSVIPVVMSLGSESTTTGKWWLSARFAWIVGVASLIVYGLGILAYVVWRLNRDGKAMGWMRSILTAVLRINVYLVVPAMFFLKALPGDSFFQQGTGQLISRGELSGTALTWMWLVLLAVVLVAGFYFIGWTHRRDSRTIGGAWSIFLGTARGIVYCILAAVFLLPACQKWEESTTRHRIVIAFDVTPSITETRDDPLREGVRYEELPTRQDKVIALLTNTKDLPDGKKTDFMKELQKRAPVTSYVFGREVDDNYVVFTEGTSWRRDQWELRQRYTEHGDNPPKGIEWSKLDWDKWLKPNLKRPPEEGLKDEQLEEFKKLLELDRRRFGGTNLGDSLQKILQLEGSNPIQAFIIFSDGRSTEGTPESVRELRQRAEQARIPIFVVAVGEDRPKVKLDITDVRVPARARPEDSFRVTTEIVGEGLPDKDIKVYLDVSHPQGGDLIVKDVSKADKPVAILLGKKITLEPNEPVKLSKGEGGLPPRAEVEIPIDAAKLLENAGKKTEAGAKLELAEGQWKFEVRVPRDKGEHFPHAEHKSDPAVVQVVKRPLRILLFAGGPMRDYQFCRALFVREAEKNRAEVCIYLQPSPGQSQPRPGVVQDVPPDRLLKNFPQEFSTTVKDADRFNNLQYYDLIIAFDPDWGQLARDQLENVKRWVDKGGGLIAVGHPANTLQLARPGKTQDKLKPILELYPVILKDTRLHELDRTTTEPWRLNFPGVNDETEYMRLEEGGTDSNPLAGWAEFFDGKSGETKGKPNPERGFYNYYPLVRAKDGATVVATFADPRARLADGKEQPYLVTVPYGRGKVVWIGSGETWRLRKYREAYHERFWTKLARFAGAGKIQEQNSRITLYYGRVFKQNDFVPIEARITDANDKPLSPEAKPKLTLKPPAGAALDGPSSKPYEMSAKPGSEGWFTGKFQVKIPGEYSFELKVDEFGINESVQGKFVVKESDPELDNTRPDFEQLYALAGDATNLLANNVRDESLRKQIREKLQRPRLVGKTSFSKEEEVKSDYPRLYFELKNADLIPQLLVPLPPNVQRNKSNARSLWDEGLTLGTVGDYVDPDGAVVVLFGLTCLLALLISVFGIVALVMTWSGNTLPGGIVWPLLVSLVLLIIVLPLWLGVRYFAGEPLMIAYVLAVVVGLLSLEWLTRKLLRLA